MFFTSPHHHNHHTTTTITPPQPLSKGMTVNFHLSSILSPPPKEPLDTMQQKPISRLPTEWVIYEEMTRNYRISYVRVCSSVFVSVRLCSCLFVCVCVCVFVCVSVCLSVSRSTSHLLLHLPTHPLSITSTFHHIHFPSHPPSITSTFHHIHLPPHPLPTTPTSHHTHHIHHTHLPPRPPRPPQVKTCTVISPITAVLFAGPAKLPPHVIMEAENSAASGEWHGRVNG